MVLKLRDFSLEADFKKGAITSLVMAERERVSGLSPLFRVRLRDKIGKAYIVTSFDALFCSETEDGAIYTGFDPDIAVSVRLNDENGEAAWRIKVTPRNEDYFVEWVDFPSITLPLTEENNDSGFGGKILFPYNEGVLISNIESRDTSWLNYREPEYPSSGCYGVFPNMVSSQMLGYVWQDVGLYMGAHDSKRGVKDINFVRAENGVTFRFRLFCGTEFAQSFETDYPIVFARTEGRWESVAERYRKWFEANLPNGAKKITQNNDLPEWYEASPLVVSYPVRGVHDMDEMKPNRLYPYTNALPILDEIKHASASRLLVLLMHWEGTAPWAPPYVLPPFGDAENFDEFKRVLHQRGDMLGVYCSGFGYTLQSNLIAEYNKKSEYEEKDLWRGMCADVDGRVKISDICTGQRVGYDICPASEVGRELLNEAYVPLLESDLDYVQILDQNHGGGQYFCYSREHGHAPAPGPWMTENMQNMLSEWNKVAQKTVLGCESAAAEPFIGNLLYSDNRYELNYAMGESVPLYAYIYHEYVRNFMGNQVGCPFDTESDTLRYRLAYSFCAGDSMTLVLTQDGELMSHWGTRDFEHAPNKEKALALIGNLTALYKNGAKKFLYAGRMISSPEVKCESIRIKGFDSNPFVKLDAILHSAWEAEDGSRGLILVNPDDREAICEVNGNNITVPALGGVIVSL